MQRVCMGHHNLVFLLASYQIHVCCVQTTHRDRFDPMDGCQNSFICSSSMMVCACVGDHTLYKTPIR